VFYSIGFVGLILSVDVITTDTSRLRDRGLAYAFTSFPYVISAFAGPKSAEAFYDSNWRWGYGIFAIILPIVAAPLLIVLVTNKRKAEKAGLLVEKDLAVQRTFGATILFYAIEFDSKLCDTLPRHASHKGSVGGESDHRR
jgi:MFS family permease